MQAPTSGWHVGQWGTLGWLETGVKGIGILAAFIALAQALPSGIFTLGGNPRLAAIIVLALVSVLWTGAVATRLQQREIVSMVFSVLNALGHYALIAALLWLLPDRTLPIIFGAAYLIGELIKRRWLMVSGYTESGRTPRKWRWSPTCFWEPTRCSSSLC
ncbi:MAG: hypothetical protein U0694_02960 [Anaerolineae bacterium]